MRRERIRYYEENLKLLPLRKLTPDPGKINPNCKPGLFQEIYWTNQRHLPAGLCGGDDSLSEQPDDDRNS